MITLCMKVWKQNGFAREFYGTFGEFYGTMVRKFVVDASEANLVKYVSDLEKEIDELSGWYPTVGYSD